jgi:hypothetical protein
LHAWVSWLADFEEETEISARVFVISGFEDPEILSAIKSSTFEIAEIDEVKSLDAFIMLDYLVRPGDDQTITVQVYDVETGYAIEGAYVEVFASGDSIETFGDYTDLTGEVSFSWMIDYDSEPGFYDVTIDVAADGYQPESFFESFDVAPAFY